jgi:hypothetical protein
MMQHLDEGALQAMLDDELPGWEADAARRHISTCGECTARFEEVERSSLALSSALSLLQPVEGRPRSAAVRMPPSIRAASRWGALTSLRAAAILLVFAAGASATIPGSPVRSWISDRLEGPMLPVAATGRAADEAMPATMAMDTPPQLDEAGVSVEPAAGRIRIVLTGASPDLQVRALLTDSPRGGVYASGDAASARFRTAIGTIEVIGAGPGELRIEVPRSVQQAVLEVDGTTYLTKDGDQLRLSVPSREASDAELVFRIRT